MNLRFYPIKDLWTKYNFVYGTRLVVKLSNFRFIEVMITDNGLYSPIIKSENLPLDCEFALGLQ